MTPEQFMMYLFASFGVGSTIVGVIVFLLFKNYIPSYLNEKGKNLATKEDVAGITEEIERVRSQYSVLLEELKVKHQLRLAAVDRRLQAHQEAFTLWREILANMDKDQMGSVVIKCQTWWEENCLYLEPNVREAFVESYSAAHLQKALYQGNVETKIIMENSEKITKFPQVLFGAIQLPLLSEVESEPLKIAD